MMVEAAVNANPDGHTIVLITNSQAVGAASGTQRLFRDSAVQGNTSNRSLPFR